ncbi:hypothetical protein [Henriciella aquimarina]|uniref:hypothetical protein n=1 Tax=Henriciella aquimarina TaxID=545261 RepID=UPI00117AB169|nr:hypothetical protein [Henriciella aquimarina]
MIKKLLLGAGVAALVAGAANAQSAFGETASEEVQINATVAPIVRISGLADELNFNLGEAFFNQSGPNTYQNDMFCVYSNVSDAGSYSITASGTPAPAFGSNAWAIENTGGDILAFTMKVFDGSLDRVVGPGDNWSGFSSAAWTGTRPDTGDCVDTGDNTRLQVTFSKDDVLGANAGEYTGSVTLIASAT